MTLALIELGVRIFVNPGEYPYVRSNEIYGLTRVPGMTGDWIDLQNGIRAHYHINNLGFNDTRDRYPQRHTALRIAVLGDSQVEALHVDVDKAFPALLEADLTDCTGGAEVLRFGMSGMPLSQYEHELLYILETFAPDVVIVNLVSNDYSESLAHLAWHPFFWTYTGTDGHFEPSAPVPFFENDYERWREHTFATRRLIRIMRGNKPLSVPTSRGFEYDLEQLSADESRQVATLTDEMIGRMADEAQQVGAALVLVSEFGPAAVYGNTAPPVDLHWRDVVFESASRHDVPMIDLIPALAADYAQHGQGFEFPHDPHWNERGHRVVASVLEDWVRANECE